MVEVEEEEGIEKEVVEVGVYVEVEVEDEVKEMIVDWGGDVEEVLVEVDEEAEVVL